MLPHKLHIEQINRFHKKLNDISEQILFTDKEKQGHLSIQYFKLTELWIKIDEFVEFTLKHELDLIDNQNKTQP